MGAGTASSRRPEVHRDLFSPFLLTKPTEGADSSLPSRERVPSAPGMSAAFAGMVPSRSRALCHRSPWNSRDVRDTRAALRTGLAKRRSAKPGFAVPRALFPLLGGSACPAGMMGMGTLPPGRARPPESPGSTRKTRIWVKPHILESRHVGLTQAGGARRAVPLHPFIPDPRDAHIPNPLPVPPPLPAHPPALTSLPGSHGSGWGRAWCPPRSWAPRPPAAVPAWLQLPVRFPGCDSRGVIPGAIPGVQFPVCDSRYNSRGAIPGAARSAPARAPPPRSRDGLRGRGRDGDLRERAGGGQEEPERGAGREREAVSALGERGCAGLGWPARPARGWALWDSPGPCAGSVQNLGLAACGNSAFPPLSAPPLMPKEAASNRGWTGLKE